MTIVPSVAWGVLGKGQQASDGQCRPHKGTGDSHPKWTMYDPLLLNSLEDLCSAEILASERKYLVSKQSDMQLYQQAAVSDTTALPFRPF